MKRCADCEYIGSQGHIQDTEGISMAKQQTPRRRTDKVQSVEDMHTFMPTPTGEGWEAILSERGKPEVNDTPVSEGVDKVGRPASEGLLLEGNPMPDKEPLVLAADDGSGRAWVMGLPVGGLFKPGTDEDWVPVKDGMATPLPSPDDMAANFAAVTGKEAESLVMSALAAPDAVPT